MKHVVFALVFTFTATVAFGQASASKQLEWDQPNATVAEASAYTFKYYPDAAAAGTTLSGVTCFQSGTTTVCRVSFPAFAPGGHTLQLTATNAAGESAKSAVFSFTFVVVPSAPSGVRVQ